MNAVAKERQGRRKAAFQRVALLRKDLGSFNAALIALQQEHAKIYDAIAIVRRMSSEKLFDLSKAIDALDRESL